MSDAVGVVITGVYGVGKSAVVEEMAGMLEQEAISYAAIDVDWLWWFEVTGLGDEESRRVLFANLESVVGNYLDVGVMRFLLAWSIRDQRDLDALRDAVPFPLQVIRLTAPIAVIKERLAPAVTAERKDDLRIAERWLGEGTGSNLGDMVVANDRTIREVAAEILDWLEWH